MQITTSTAMEKEINGCQVRISFAGKPMEGMIEDIQSILSNAYEERVEADLMEIAGRTPECG